MRSAKDTVLDVVGRPLDEQLEREAMSAYSIDRHSAREIIAAVRNRSRVAVAISGPASRPRR
ncbi:hypothetical protein MAHJHV47_46760 [Mycobacterium avium subsp. hominissuis]